MSNAWSIDPYKLAAQQRTLEGTVAVADMQRAAKLLVAEQGFLDYKVAVTQEDRRCIITGSIDGALTLNCQRCLQPFAHTVHCKFAVSPVRDEEAAKQLPDDYEAVLLHDGKVNILELLEDELILALPQVAMHDPSECSAALEHDQVQEENNPFQILQKLRVKKNGHMAEDK